MENIAEYTSKPLSVPAAGERTLFTVEEFVTLPEFSYLSKSGLRNLIFKSRPQYSAAGDLIEGNGMVAAGVLIRLGRRVLIDAAKFREWTYSQRETLVRP